ncbi:ParB N-terminal domain-containing protein [Arthrobacter sp.]|uniref:ParB/RepB/Spo0J family partition protein n=1 Tax=Arthrobacter sp. TaxID=1667 RepID=UPI00259048E7|nr:ParB N-terminal domain-containing protein [Arthrobacter sp.]
MSAQTLITVDPSALLVDLNIREAALDAAFVDNIRANEMIQPPVVHKTDGGLRMVMGHRRTLAAVDVGHQEMCVIVTETPEDSEHLIKQISENDARKDFTDAERARGYEQLALLGVSAAKIAERTGAADAATVKKALAARNNAKGTAALDVGRALYQALALVEFDDEYALSQLEEIIERRPGQVQHRLAQLRNERSLCEKRAEAGAPYVGRGLTVVDSIGSYPGAGDVLCLSALEDAEGIQPGEDVADCVYVRLSRVGGNARVDLGIKDWGQGLQSTSLLRRGERRPDD